MNLTHQQIKALFDYDPLTGVVTRNKLVNHDKRAKQVVGDLNSAGYLSVWITPKRYQLHRVIWMWVHGVWPTKPIDHLNHVRTDNRLSNLREASQLENTHNRTKSKRNWSGFIGVYWYARKHKWHAQITANRKRYHLGYFNTPELASAAYQAAKRIHHPTAPVAQQGA